jgi:hypothetical protein
VVKAYGETIPTGGTRFRPREKNLKFTNGLVFSRKTSPSLFSVGTGFRPTAGVVKGGGDMPQPDPIDPRPSDPPFLFVTLLAARKAGDPMLESLARDWLAEVGIRVVFDDALDSTFSGKGAEHV